MTRVPAIDLLGVADGVDDRVEAGGELGEEAGQLRDQRSDGGLGSDTS